MRRLRLPRSLSVLSFVCLSGCVATAPLKSGDSTAASPAESAPSAAPALSAAATQSISGSAAIQVAGRKIEVSSVELDATCTRVVAPFELSDNFGELLKLGTELAASKAGNDIARKMDTLLATPGTASSVPATPGGSISQPLRRAALRMNWLPMEVENLYGSYLLDDMRKQGRILNAQGRVGARLYPLAQTLLDEVLKGVSEAHPYKFQVFVSTEAGENAMALPGGFVVLDKALLEKPELRDKASFALAHELAHVLQRHQTRALQARVVDALLLKDSLPDMIRTLQSAKQQPQAVLALLTTGKLLFEAHSESQELRADACAMRLLDDGAMSDGRLLSSVQAFVRSLPKPAAGSDPPPSAGNRGLDALTQFVQFVQRPIDAHPSTTTRIANFNAMLVELRQRPGAVAKPASAATKPVAPGPSLVKQPAAASAASGAAKPRTN